MKFIVNNKIYDTETAEKLCTFSKQWEIKTIVSALYLYPNTHLYKTAKGAYFLTCRTDCGRHYIEVINENTAKQYLMHNNYSKYVELFGELEEAERRINMQKVTFFDTREELAKLTGLSTENYCDELWKAGFNLDDWDFGIQTEKEWTEDWDVFHPHYEYWLLTHMEGYCARYKHVEYNEKHYYMLYHS